MVRSSVRSFEKGLVSDVLGVDRALLEAFDVYLARSGELRFRGPKENVTPAIDVSGDAAEFTTAFAAHPRFGEMRVGTNTEEWDPLGTGSALNTYVRRPADAGWTDLGEVLASGTVGTQFSPFTDRFAFAAGRAITCQPPVTFATPPAAGTQFRGAGMYAGAIKANYSTGTISRTINNNQYIGAGTLFLANIEPGMFISIDNGSFNEPFNRVARVVSNTVLEMDDPSYVTDAGKTYRATSWARYNSRSGFWSGRGTVSASVFTQHQGRVVAGGVIGTAAAVGTDGPHKPHMIAWSALSGERDPNDGSNIGANHWNVNASITVEEGIGKNIVGLASYAGMLLILKDNGVSVLTGGLATDGSDAGQAIQMISGEIGCQGLQAYDASTEGIYFADEQGAYLWNGRGLTDITKARITREWRANMQGTITVSALRDRVIFQGGPDRDQIYVYDTVHEMWTRQRVAQSYSQAARVFDTSAEQIREDAAQRVGSATSVQVHDWQTDLESASVIGTGDDAGSTTTPRADVTTHPLPTSREKGGKGRPVRLFVEGWMRAITAVTTPTLVPTITFGSRLHGELGAEAPVQTTLEAISTTGASFADAVEKRRIPASEAASAASVRLVQTDGAEDGAIYSVTLESAETGRHAG